MNNLINAIWSNYPLRHGYVIKHKDENAKMSNKIPENKACMVNDGLYYKKPKVYF